MNEDSFVKKVFRDHKGYWRWKDSKRLVHRYIAEKEIYNKNKKSINYLLKNIKFIILIRIN